MWISVGETRVTGTVPQGRCNCKPGKTYKGRLYVTKKLRKEFEAIVDEHENKADFLHGVSEFTTQSQGRGSSTRLSFRSNDVAKKEYEDLQEKFKAMMESRSG